MKTIYLDDPTFGPGDVVCLKGGGPDMTVVETSTVRERLLDRDGNEINRPILTIDTSDFTEEVSYDNDRVKTLWFNQSDELQQGVFTADSLKISPLAER